MSARQPHVGDSADHKSGQLDPRPVSWVSDDRTAIKLRLFTSDTPELPAANYTFRATSESLPLPRRTVTA